MSQASVTVVIVTFNSGISSEESIRRVAGSTVPVEVIVVDNGSDIEGLELLRSLADELDEVNLIENGCNLGFAAANNIVLRELKSNYLLVLNPDCLVEENSVERMVEMINRYPEAAMAGCMIRNRDGSEQAGCRRNLPTFWNLLVEYSGFWRLGGRFKPYLLNHMPPPSEPAWVEAISGAFMLIRDAAVEQVGLLDEGYFLHWEDLDWCKRFHQKQLKILFVPTVEVTHLKGESSKSLQWRVEHYKQRGMLRYFWKYHTIWMTPITLLMVLAAWSKVIPRLSSRG